MGNGTAHGSVGLGLWDGLVDPTLAGGVRAAIVVGVAALPAVALAHPDLRSVLVLEPAGAQSGPWSPARADLEIVRRTPEAGPVGLEFAIYVEVMLFLVTHDVPLGEVAVSCSAGDLAGAPAWFQAAESALVDLVFGESARFLTYLRRLAKLPARALIAWASYLARRGAPFQALTVIYALGGEMERRMAAEAVVSCWRRVRCPRLAIEWVSSLAWDGAAKESLADALLREAEAEDDQAHRALGAAIALIARAHPEAAEKLRRHVPAATLQAALVPAHPHQLGCAGSPVPRRTEYPILFEVREGRLVPVTTCAAQLSVDARRSITEAATRREWSPGVLVGTLGAPDVVANCVRAVPECPFDRRVQQAVYVVEANLDIATKVLATGFLDHALAESRVSWFFGADAADDLERYFLAHPKRPLPNLSLLGGEVAARAEIVAVRRDEQFVALADEWDRSADDAFDLEIDRRLAGEGGGPLRVWTYTTKFNYHMPHHIHDLCRGLRAAGAEVCVFEETEPTERLTKNGMAVSAAAFRPHVVMLSNQVRPTFPLPVPAVIPVVALVEDPVPLFESPEVVANLGDNDFACTASTVFLDRLRPLGYPHLEFIPLGVDADRFSPHPAAPPPASSVAVIMHIGTLSEPASCPGLFAWLTAQIDAGQDDTIRPLAHYEAMVRQGAAHLGLDLVADTVPEIAREVWIWVTRHVHRTRVVDWLLDAGIPVELYGQGWDSLPKYQCHARGELAGGPELCRAYQASKVVLHVNEFVNCHPRVFETIASGGFVAVKTGPYDHSPGELASCFELGRELMVFTSRDELLGIVQRAFTDEEWRSEVIEAGRRRVLADHTYAQRMPRILAEVVRGRARRMVA